MRVLLSSILLPIVISSQVAVSFAYTQQDREDAIKFVTEDVGFPMLDAWNKVTPRQLRTMTILYTTTLKEGAFEHFDASELEVIYAAVSAMNNCEVCLSFHSYLLGEAGTLAKEEISEMLDGGLPKEPKMRALVVGAKYAMAHKGIILPREKIHLQSMGISGEEKLNELVFAAGLMNAFNMNYVHLISEGLEVEDFLQEAGPFSQSVYKSREPVVYKPEIVF